MPEGLNKCMFIGYLGADPEIRYTQNNLAVCRFRIGVTESYQSRGSERQERTEWVQIVVWAKMAEVVGKFLSKGRQVYVEGRLQTRSWEDREGKKRWTTEVVASKVLFLGPAGRSERPSSDSGASDAVPQGMPEGEPFPADDDDIPF